MNKRNNEDSVKIIAIRAISSILNQLNSIAIQNDDKIMYIQIYLDINQMMI